MKFHREFEDEGSVYFVTNVAVGEDPNVDRVMQQSPSSWGSPTLFGEIAELIGALVLLLFKSRSTARTLVVLRKPPSGSNEWETVYERQAGTSKELTQLERELRDNWESIRSQFPH